ncbi:MAG: ABC transporter permease subunit, partial [Arenicellales bacterium]|nr:ABC transporter permease subunit [Arenicellales bacterium]
MSFVDGEGNFTLLHYTRLFEQALYVKVLLITIKVAAWTTIFSILAGYPVAYLLATVRDSTRNTMIIWVLMPFWTSFLVRTFAWIVLLGRKGAINDLLTSLGIVEYPIKLIYNFNGVMIGMVHALMPLCVLTMLAVMQNIDKNLTKAASTLGARGGQAFWRIYFPLSLPGVAAGGLLIFITSLGFFITPALLGGARDTMIVQLIIFQINDMLNWGFAGAISMLLLVTVLIIFFLYDRLLGLSTLSGGSPTETKSQSTNPVSRLGAWAGTRILVVLGSICAFFGALYDAVVKRRPDKSQAFGSRGILWIAGLLIIFFLAAPVFFVIPVSFTEEGFLGWPPKGFSWQWYQSLTVATSPYPAAAITSLVVASCSALLGMAFGVPAAFMLVRKRFFGKGAVFAFLVSPIITPHIILAVSLFYLYAKISLVGTYLGLILGHTVLAIPYVVVTVMAIIKNYDERLDQAAWTLGATKIRTLWHITFPIIRAGLIAAFMFAFIISFDELTMALFLTGGEFATLPRQMWVDAIMRVNPTLAAVATLILIFMTVIILFSEFM